MKKFILITVLLVGMLFISVYGYTESENILTNNIEKSTFYNLVIKSPDGRTAFIDFSGGKVIYTGDLPVEDSAKLFFDAVSDLCLKEGK